MTHEEEPDGVRGGAVYLGLKISPSQRSVWTSSEGCCLRRSHDACLGGDGDDDEGAPPPISASLPLLVQDKVIRLDRKSGKFVKTLKPVSVWTIVHLSMGPKGSSREDGGEKARGAVSLFPCNPRFVDKTSATGWAPLLTHTRARTYNFQHVLHHTLVRVGKSDKRRTSAARILSIRPGLFFCLPISTRDIFPSTFPRLDDPRTVFSLSSLSLLFSSK